jgi:capsular polysaccharide biosynthesis protein
MSCTARLFRRGYSLQILAQSVSGRTLLREAKESIVDLVDYIHLVRKYWRTITMLAAVGLLASVAASLLMQPTYTARTSVIISVSAGTSASELYQSAAYSKAQALNYVQLTTASMILQPVIDSLGLNTTPQELAQHVSSAVLPDTAILSITVSDASAEGSSRLANAIASQLSKTVDDLSASNGDNRPVRVVVVNPAVSPSAPSSPNPIRNAALGLGIGIALGVGQAWARSVVPDLVRRRNDRAAIASNKRSDAS